jgi:hypothetical protein
MEAEAGELIGSDVRADGTAARGVGQQVAKQVAKVLFGVGHVRVAVHYRSELGVAVAAVVVEDQCVGLQHGGEALGGTCFVAYGGELVEVVGDLSLVPGKEDGLDIWKVLVERGSANAGLLSDPRHRHRQQPVLSNEGGGRVEHGVAHLAPMGLDRLGPQPRHDIHDTSRCRRRHGDLTETDCLINSGDVHGHGDAHSGEQLVARIEKMLAAGRITEDEAARVRAAETGTIDDVVREIQLRHAREWRAAAVAEGRVSERDAAEALDRLERGDDPDAIRALRRRRDRS